LGEQSNELDRKKQGSSIEKVTLVFTEIAVEV
jgi:hypothetical protein